ncbi:outer membrane lipoprotein-sorting protein [Treponema sp.]
MKKTMKGLIAIAAISLLGASYAIAEPSGLEIIQSVYDRDQGKDMSGTLTMTLVSSRGSERVRVMKQISVNQKDGDKKLMVFQSPADVRGTAFMNWSYNAEGKSDDQWIYLPALKKVKRISSEGKSDYFMGSDFTYDDLGDRHPSKDTHTLKGSETVNGEACWVIESIPLDLKDLYSRTVTWVSKEKNMGVKREYYDQRGSLLKELSIIDIKKVSGIWVIQQTEMKNVQKNSKTQMAFSDVAINSGISESDFTERSMTRGL